MVSQSLNRTGNVNFARIGQPFCDAGDQGDIFFLEDNIEADALQVTKLHKYRWQIELFFKWVKQHFRIKVFWGKAQMP